MDDQIPPAHWEYLDGYAAAALSQRCRLWREKYPDGGLLALVAEASVDQAKALGTLAGQARLILVGAMFPRLIVHGRFAETGMLLLWFARMPEYQVVDGLLAQEGGQTCLHPLADFLAGHARPTGEDMAFLCFDGMLPNIGSLLEHLYLDLGDSVTYLGCNAGSETFQARPCLFVGETWYQHAVLALLFPGPVSARLAHGYTVSEQTVVASSGSGNLLIQLDHRPALSMYEELVRAGYGQALTADNFYEMAVHFPVAIVRADGEPLVRIPVALTDSGAMYCVGEVPANALLAAVAAPEAGDTWTIERLAATLQQSPARATLLFACAGRCLHLGPAAALAEIAGLQQRLPERPLFGAVSLGEIGSTPSGYPLFHNGALIAINLQWEEL